MMNHPTEEQFVVYYYGEGGEIEDHIGSCEQCRASYQALQRVLNSVDSFPVPERAPEGMAANSFFPKEPPPGTMKITSSVISVSTVAAHEKTGHMRKRVKCDLIAD